MGVGVFVCVRALAFIFRQQVSVSKGIKIGINHLLKAPICFSLQFLLDPFHSLGAGLCMLVIKTQMSRIFTTACLQRLQTWLISVDRQLHITKHQTLNYVGSWTAADALHYAQILPFFLSSNAFDENCVKAKFKNSLKEDLPADKRVGWFPILLNAPMACSDLVALCYGKKRITSTLPFTHRHLLVRVGFRLLLFVWLVGWLVALWWLWWLMWLFLSVHGIEGHVWKRCD